MAPDLGERGRRLWEALHATASFGPAQEVLVEEACRIADRLDKLDQLLRGETDVWCRLVHDLRTEDYELKIDSALAEARQQANALRQIVTDLKPASGAGKSAPVGKLDELRTRREQRRRPS